MLDQNTKALLKEKAAYIRLDIVEQVFRAKSGHPGGSLSSADILSYLYFKELRVDPKNPDDPERDRFVLSKGHASPLLYGALAEKGFFPKEDLKTFRQTTSYLQGHPDKKGIPGVDMTTGSLGIGISTACGMALAGKISNKDYRVYALCGDGEMEEGQVWEAAMFAHHYELDNLCVFVDFNGLQIDGKITDVIDPTPIDEKFKAFGWNVICINGNDLDEIDEAVCAAKAFKGKPTAIVASTTKGKGVSFMENNAGWHGKAPNEEQYQQAVSEIIAAMAK
ncbi:MAG: transketolase [Ruminococcaceae bacterium]|nr:transketolase [Oscillospiraceae bacterium]